MDIEQLGYFLYMEQCDKEEAERQQAELLKVNVEQNDDLVAEQTTQTRNRE